LATFSARINAAYRFGLIGAKFRKSLHYVRKVRNAFAHHTKTPSLDDSPYRDWISQMEKGSDADRGTVDWRLEFPDASVAVAQSRITETTRGTCIYTFVLHAPPVPLGQVEGALEQQSATLRQELATLKALMEP
jgi:hypothetical protein